MSPPDSGRDPVAGPGDPLAPPSESPAGIPVAAPRRATRVDWAQIAALVAAGLPVAEVAREAGCTRQHVWRVMRRARGPDPSDPAASEAAMNARLAALRPRVVEALARAVEADNARVVMWLADRLRVGTDAASRPGALTHEEWVDILDGAAPAPRHPRARRGREFT